MELPPIDPALPGGEPNLIAQLVSIIVSTCALEDLGIVGIAMLVQANKLNVYVAVLGCFLGLLIGDLGMWFTGRVIGTRLLKRPWVQRRLPDERIAAIRERLSRRMGATVCIARMLPGARMPLYFAAGTLGMGTRFVVWTVVAIALWTPLLMFLVAMFGKAIVEPIARLTGMGWWGIPIGGLVAYALLQIVSAIANRGDTTPPSRTG